MRHRVLWGTVGWDARNRVVHGEVGLIDAGASSA